MGFLHSLSLRSRFLIAPFIGVILTLILYFASNAILLSHSNLFQQLNESNLPQVSEISRITVLLFKNHTELDALLDSASEIPDEEQIYLQGRSVLNGLHEIEDDFNMAMGSAQKVIIDQADIFEQFRVAFARYREATISAIELSTVDARLAKKELLNSDKLLKKLNDILLMISEFHVHNLTGQSGMVEGALYDHSLVTSLAIVLVLIMIFSALFFSGRMSADLEKINQAMIGLSAGKKDIQLPALADEYMQKLTAAVAKFKQTLQTNEEQQVRLSRAIEDIEDNKERYYSLLDITATAIIAIDHTQHIVLFNKAAERMFGYDGREIIGEPLERLMPEQYRIQHKKDVMSFEDSDINIVATMRREPVLALRKNGEEFYIEASLGKSKLTKETLMTAAITDVTERMKAEEKILRQAHFDALTNLPNRFLSLDRLSQLLNEARRKNESAAVLFLDLDDFKRVNDSLGHETGDELLIEAAKRLRTVIRSGDTVGRLGGDEFIVLLPRLMDVADVRPVVENLIEQLRSTFKVGGHELVLSASIGIAVFPEDGNTASELLRNADSAMYHAKELGRNTYSYYTETMNQGVSRRLSLEEQMHGALERGEFRLVYQPQVDINTGNLIGAEALLRWTNPVLGDVFPNEFIPIAEQSGLIVPLGQFVLTEALGKTARWQNDCESGFRIAVNLSPRQFRDPNLASFVGKVIKESSLTAESLELEITEGVLMTGHSFIDDALLALNKLGVRLAMDDFGTGYSSLSYLRRYPFDILKIDRSFVNDIIEVPADRELVNATIAMAHGLGLKVVAEGVETKAQLAHLAAQGCEYAQGYLFSRPVPPEMITEMLARQA